jgi:hypothetical protein
MNIRRLSIVLVLLIIGLDCFCQESNGRKTHKSHLSITPGIDFATMRSQDANGTQVNFPEGTNFRVGAEFEFPAFRGKWAAIIEPAFQRYTANGPYLLIYRSLETSIGVRRYFRVNKKTGLYLNGATVGDLPIRHTMELSPNFDFVSTGLKVNLAAGVGLAISRFTMEYRYYTQRTRKDDTGSFTYNYNKRSIIVGFRLY